MDQLMGIQQDDRIRSIGLTNFDTKHLSELLEEGAPIVSNQACPPPPSIHPSIVYTFSLLCNVECILPHSRSFL